MMKKKKKIIEPFPCSVYISKLSKRQSILSLCEMRTYLCLETKRLLSSHRNITSIVPVRVVHFTYAICNGVFSGFHEDGH